jgi:hypothetical protein
MADTTIDTPNNTATTAIDTTSANNKINGNSLPSDIAGAGQDWLGQLGEARVDRMFNPYRSISGVSAQNSEQIGRLATGLAGMGTQETTQPVNQFAQVLQNNKSLMGAAGDFAGNFSNALQKPLGGQQMMQNQMQKSGENYLKVADYANKAIANPLLERGYYDNMAQTYSDPSAWMSTGGQPINKNQIGTNGTKLNMGASKAVVVDWIKSMNPATRQTPDDQIMESASNGAYDAFMSQLSGILTTGKGSLDAKTVNQMTAQTNRNMESRMGEFDQNVMPQIKTGLQYNLLPDSSASWDVYKNYRQLDPKTGQLTTKYQADPRITPALSASAQAGDTIGALTIGDKQIGSDGITRVWDGKNWRK